MQEFFGVVIHDGIVQIEPFQVVDRCSDDVTGHGWAELPAELAQLIFIAEGQHFFFLCRQEVRFNVCRLC